MPENLTAIQKFVDYVKTLRGDEKGEAQVFCDRLFQAFGHGGYKEAGAELESRQKRRGKGTGFIDLLWAGRLLLEMKKRGEKLQKHYTQAFDYWQGAVPRRPRYVMLCNFDEFWIYDFDTQLYDPVDRIPLEQLPDRSTAFNFLLPREKKPLFGNNRVDVTRAAAGKVASVFNSLVGRREDRERAQRFVLQCVVAMFAQSTNLLPKGLFSELLNDCRDGQSTYDLLGGLFRQMNDRQPAAGGRFKGVAYFNGGIFHMPESFELNTWERDTLISAANENWSKVQPPIFGALFQGSMNTKDRHATGAHFTSEADIQKVVHPTIVRPWTERIDAADKLKDLKALLEGLRRFRVLDPACGSGNFLYVAYRELVQLELQVMAKIHTDFGSKASLAAGSRSRVSPKQLFGIDINEFAVELAKVTVTLAKELAVDETGHWLNDAHKELAFEFDDPLPLLNLNDNVKCDDALFCTWPKVNAIIGNPPYLDARKITMIYGADYSKRIRARYPKVPGRSDLCVHWFRRAHDELQPGDRAGLVGTNSIRQNYSRVGGLDYIVQNGGAITEAVSSQVWSGEAVVHVSIVNWVKGDAAGPKKLYTQQGDSVDSEWRVESLDHIPSSLSSATDVSSAVPLACCQSPKPCFEGQQPGHDGFRIGEKERENLLRDDSKCSVLIFPYLTGNELLGAEYLHKPRFLIDFGEMNMLAAAAFQPAFRLVQERVLPEWDADAKKELERTGKQTGEHQNRLKTWWQLKRRRQAMLAALAPLPRYIVCVRHTKRPIFEFLAESIRPDSALTVFAFADDYSFGILQSGIHWSWFMARCSTIKADFRYTSDTVFDTFPWPQTPTLSQAIGVASEADSLRKLRREVMACNKWSLRDLYRTLDLPGENPLREAHNALDVAVRAAYGMKTKADPLAFLLTLNQEVVAREAAKEAVVAPGLPPCVENAETFMTDDCISMDG